MKKLFSCILLTLLLALTSTTVFAEDSKQYPISQYDITIQLSSEWTVATKDSIPDSSAYDGVSETRDSIAKDIEKGTFDLYAIKYPSVQCFFSIMRNPTIERPSIPDAKNLSALFNLLKSQSKYKIYEQYNCSAGSFVIYETESSMRATSFKNGKAMCFDYIVTDYTIDETMRAEFKSILNTVDFRNKPESVVEDKLPESYNETKPAVTSKVTAKQDASSATPSSSQAESSKEEQSSSSTITSSNSTVSTPIAQQAKEATKVSSFIPTILILIASIILIVGIVFTIIFIRKRKNR